MNPFRPTMPRNAKGSDIHECLCHDWGRLKISYRACATQCMTYIMHRRYHQPSAKRPRCAKCPIGIAAAKKLKVKKIVRYVQVTEQRCY